MQTPLLKGDTGATGPTGGYVTGSLAANPFDASWLPCDGSMQTSATYPALAALLGSTSRMLLKQAVLTDGTTTMRSVATDGTTAVAIGNAGTIFTSTDGVNWTLRSCPVATVLNSVIFANGLFVAVGDASASIGVIITSPDGTTWTQRTSNFGNFGAKGVIWGNSLFVVFGTGGTIVTSPDGITWTARTSNLTAVNCNQIIWANSLFVAVAAGGKISTSTDGATWTARSSNVTTPLLSVAYGSGYFIAVGGPFSLGTNAVKSADGTNWSAAGLPNAAATAASTLLNVVFANSMFVVAGTVGYLATSTNGTTWAYAQFIQGANSTDGLCKIYYLNGQWIIIPSGTSSYIYTSLNGAIWVQCVGGLRCMSSVSTPWGISTCVKHGNRLIFLDEVTNFPNIFYADCPSGSQFQMPLITAQGVPMYMKAA